MVSSDRRLLSDDAGIQGAGSLNPAVRPARDSSFISSFLCRKRPASPRVFLKQFLISVRCKATLPRKSLLFHKNRLTVYRLNKRCSHHMNRPTAPVECMHGTAVMQNICNHAETAHRMYVLSADVIFKVQNPVKIYPVQDELREVMDP